MNPVSMSSMPSLTHHFLLHWTKDLLHPQGSCIHVASLLLFVGENVCKLDFGGRNIYGFLDVAVSGTDSKPIYCESP